MNCFRFMISPPAYQLPEAPPPPNEPPPPEKPPPDEPPPQPPDDQPPPDQPRDDPPEDQPAELSPRSMAANWTAMAATTSDITKRTPLNPGSRGWNQSSNRNAP